MTLTLTWGGQALANPADETNIQIEREFVGSKARMIDGTLRADVAAEKATITIRWVGLSASEKSTLRTSAYLAYYTTASNLVIGNGTTTQTFSVLAVDGWSEELWYDRATADYYDVTIVFTEV